MRQVRRGLHQEGRAAQAAAQHKGGEEVDQEGEEDQEGREADRLLLRLAHRGEQSVTH